MKDVSPDSIDVEPVDAEPSEAALDAIAALLVDFVLEEESAK